MSLKSTAPPDEFWPTAPDYFWPTDSGTSYTTYYNGLVTISIERYQELLEKAGKWDNLMKLLEGDKK